MNKNTQKKKRTFIYDPVLLLSALLSAAMTELEKSMESMITVFHRYAKEGKNERTLNKKELKKLLENELPNFLKVSIFGRL